MERHALKIYDTSLRDGLRKSGISMTLDQKLRFARQLEHQYRRHRSRLWRPVTDRNHAEACQSGEPSSRVWSVTSQSERRRSGYRRRGTVQKTWRQYL